MERYISLALLLALLLAIYSCPAFADTEGVIIEDIELEAPELRQSDLVELDGIGLLDTDLLTDLVTGEDTISAEYPDSASDVIQNDSSSNYSLSETSITIGEKEKYTKLTVNATTSNGKSPKITWRSGNKKIGANIILSYNAAPQKLNFFYVHLVYSMGNRMSIHKAIFCISPVLDFL